MVTKSALQQDKAAEVIHYSWIVTEIQEARRNFHKSPDSKAQPGLEIVSILRAKTICLLSISQYTSLSKATGWYLVSNLPSGLANTHFFQLCSTIMISEFSPMCGCLSWMGFMCKHTRNSLQSYPRMCSFQIRSLQTFLPADLNLDLTPEMLSKQKLNCSSLSQQRSVTDNTVTATAVMMENKLGSKQIWLKQIRLQIPGKSVQKTEHWVLPKW